MPSTQFHLPKTVLLTLLLGAGLAFTAVAQPVYVGLAGIEDKALRKFPRTAI